MSLAHGSRAWPQEVVIDPAEPVYTELWTSLASLLRSYTAVHGLSGNRQALVESNEVLIRAHHGKKWLELRRNGTRVTWMRENGKSGWLQMTEAGRLRSTTTDSMNEEEMDMAAEAWARELMLEFE
ncbi:MAG TPA: hypothetical protein VHD85_16060 [Terracidiphilus sp.]|nr:hypothetical protein [Terracidiphilus sp.]